MSSTANNKPYSKEEREKILEKATIEGVFSLTHDERMEIAARDPDLWLEIQHVSTKDYIQRAPEGNLETLQHLQDGVYWAKATSKNPIRASIKISKMMHERVNMLRDVLNNFGKPLPEKEKAPVIDMESCRAKQKPNPEEE